MQQSNPACRSQASKRAQVPVNSNAMLFARTPQQVLAIVTLGNGTAGGFFPQAGPPCCAALRSSSATPSALTHGMSAGPERLLRSLRRRRRSPGSRRCRCWALIKLQHPTLIS